MIDLLQAKTLLEAANKDLTALNGMLNAKQFTDEIFGFHVQQASEKSLKAWLAALGEVYPYTHDLALLLRKLEARNCNISKYIVFVEYTAFAGQVRYVGLDDDVSPIDRQETIAQVQELYEKVGTIAQSSEEAKSERESE